MPVDRMEAVLTPLAARLSVKVLWQGEELDRLLDREHARMVEMVLSILARHDWVPIPEATFAIRGERGSIDILAWHPASGTLLVIEIKTVVPDIQATLTTLDRKVRLAPVMALERDWRPAHVARLLVLPDDRTARRRVEAFAETFGRVLPARTVAVKRWLSAPSGSIGGILFLPNSRAVQPRQRIAARRAGSALEGWPGT